MAAPMTNLFAEVSFSQNDEVFSLTPLFNADPAETKVSLGAGVYKDDQGRSWKLPVIRKAEKMLLDAGEISYDYLPITGNSDFIELARDSLFGPVAQSLAGKIASVQTVSGTGANHIGARFLLDHLPARTSPTRPRRVWISDPTWTNHSSIWEIVAMGNPDFEQATYKYYNPTKSALDFEGMIEGLEADATEGDILLLHACAHNPTGLDPSREQWLAIAELCQRKGLFPFFDSAYQGFASGDLDLDAWALREFATRGMEMCVAQSFSKSFGMYGQRVGAFHLVCSTVESATNSFTQLADIQRSEISTPPAYGAQIVTSILKDPRLLGQWKQDLEVMSGRLKAMRHALYNELTRLGTPGSWEHIINQVGMFSYTGLTAVEVARLQVQSHIYLLRSGRASIAGLNTGNVCYVAQCIHDVVSERPTR